MKKNNSVKSIVIERTFNVPVERVWKAITTKEEMKQWYFDLKEFKAETGFQFAFDVSHKGVSYEHRCQVKEVIPNKRISYSWRYHGQPGDSLVTFELFPEGQGARLKLTHTGVETFPKLAAYAKKNFRQGWTSIIGTSLKEYLNKSFNQNDENTTDREMVILRLIHAPVKRVWEAWADTKQVVQWWGPTGFSTTTEKRDFKPGGIWKHTMHGPDGTDYPNKSKFMEIIPYERIIYSHGGGKKGDRGVSFISTWTFEAQGDKTKITIRHVFPTAKDRDRVVKEYGAIEGGKQTLARLEEFVKLIPRS